MNTDIRTLMEFLETPIESSSCVFERFETLEGSIWRGSFPERFIYVRGKRENKVCLVAHADTFWSNSPHNIGCGIQQNHKQEIIEEDGIIYNAHGGLGADDRAGCAIVWLLRNLGHSLLITDGEEWGGLGSRFLMEKNPDIVNELNNHQFLVEFDLYSSGLFKCYSVGTDSFREYMAKSSGYIEPDRGSYTDIVTLCKKIIGVNLCVGYNQCHSTEEFLVEKEWLQTLNFARTWLDQPYFDRFEIGSQLPVACGVSEWT